MKIRVKVGTMPQEIWVTSKRIPPKVGEWIKIRENKRNYPWHIVVVDQIKFENSPDILYCVHYV